MKQQTYGEAIESLKMQSNIIYEKVGALRDCATLEEKENWNNLRRLFSHAWDEFVKLENKAWESGSSELKLKGEY